MASDLILWEDVMFANILSPLLHGLDHCARERVVPPEQGVLCQANSSNWHVHDFRAPCSNLRKDGRRGDMYF